MTSTAASSFAEAKQKTINAVQDGDPVYFHVLLPRPLKDYVFQTYSNDRIGLILAVGPRGQPDKQHNAVALFLHEAEKELLNYISIYLLVKSENRPCWRWRNAINIRPMAANAAPQRKPTKAWLVRFTS
ncbi:hypothetical protein ACO0LM_22415 [Undibacterium sp. Di26W]|uniref:hypothetical protein n=1 Tax=Undibacterium sp. Di26W TaxID=3413035 RepID=UPI003BF188E5